MDVDSSLLPKLESNQEVTECEWINKLIYPDNGILLSDKKKKK